MRIIEVVYSPLCEATGAMLGSLRRWLRNTDIEIMEYQFDIAPQRLKNCYQKSENCFIDVFFDNTIIDSIPLHQDKIYDILNIRLPLDLSCPDIVEGKHILTSDELKNAASSKKIKFYPIDRNTYEDEMTMCLCNYPFGNPPEKFHASCIKIKKPVFEQALSFESVVGIYAKYKNDVIGLLEVMPREILKKFGYMTGTLGNDNDYLSVGCYEIGYGIPRIDMIDLLMNELHKIFYLFHRKYIEGIGVFGCTDGFDPYWVYDKYNFRQTEKLSENTFVMSKSIITPCS